MGKVEIIIISAVVVLVAIVAFLYVKNSKKINSDKQKQIEDENKKVLEENKKEEQRQKQLAKTSTKTVMEQVSNQAEDYIKSLMIEDDKKQKLKQNQIVFQETSEDLTRDPAEEEAAIILGIKKQKVHVIEDDEEDIFGSYRENSISILHDMDDQNESIIKSSKTNISIDDFQEDNSVGEEFRTMSKEMKVMMLSNIFDKKENQDK